MQPQHHPPLHRLADAAATKVTETERQRGGKGETNREREQWRRREEGSPVPIAEGFTCPTEQGAPPLT